MDKIGIGNALKKFDEFKRSVAKDPTIGDKQISKKLLEDFSKEEIVNIVIGLDVIMMVETIKRAESASNSFLNDPSFI